MLALIWLLCLGVGQGFELQFPAKDVSEDPDAVGRQDGLGAGEAVGGAVVARHRERQRGDGCDVERVDGRDGHVGECLVHDPCPHAQRPQFPPRRTKPWFSRPTPAAPPHGERSRQYKRRPPSHPARLPRSEAIVPAVETPVQTTLASGQHAAAVRHVT